MAIPGINDQDEGVDVDTKPHKGGVTLEVFFQTEIRLQCVYGRRGCKKDGGREREGRGGEERGGGQMSGKEGGGAPITMATMTM